MYRNRVFSDADIFQEILSHAEKVGNRVPLTKEYVYFVALLTDFWRLYLNVIPEAVNRKEKYGSYPISDCYGEFHMNEVRKRNATSIPSEDNNHENSYGLSSHHFESVFTADGFAHEDILHIERDSFLSPTSNNLYIDIPLLFIDPFKAAHARMHLGRRRLLLQIFNVWCNGSVTTMLNRIDSNLEGMLVPPGLRLTPEFLFEHLLFLVLPPQMFSIALPILTHAIEDICRGLVNPDTRPCNDDYGHPAINCYNPILLRTLEAGAWLRFPKGEGGRPFDAGFASDMPHMTGWDREWSIERIMCNVFLIYTRHIFTETFHHPLYQYKLRNWCHTFQLCDQDGCSKQRDTTPLSKVRKIMYNNYLIVCVFFLF